MKLLEKQMLFVELVQRFIVYAHAQGYRLTFGEAYRHPAWAKEMARQGRGIANSLHCDRLAIDLHLFRDGEYLTTTEDWAPLGEWWEGQLELCAWGGRFTKPDGNHLSLEHEGRKWMAELAAAAGLAFKIACRALDINRHYFT